MLLALIVFVVVAGSIIGGYYAVTMLPGVLAARRLDIPTYGVTLLTSVAATRI